MPNPETEPSRLEIWALDRLAESKALRGQAAIRLVMMAADARKAAANLRAMRAARLRINYLQG